ncbi:uncharacterized protein LOC130725125 [Lotus japonicus]|uniref:uncharacterized protein LOC130725125 n=1 Tax=Lotus japonicus TaxID=34305 RepID=UPI00258691BF|nr:uncharacterized protein LOC130725125 [Lotus japonicus]
MDPNNMADLNIYDIIIDDIMNDTTIEDMMQEEMEFYQRRANTVKPKRTRKVIKRDREAENERLWNDYFSENPVYTEELFRRRFQMQKHVFLRIVGALGSHDPTAIECLKNFVEGVYAVFGSNNDINVLNQSPVFNEVLSGNALMVNFSVNETMYNMGYYLADGIYPPWATFVKTIPMPQGEKRQKFAKRQEAARKDVERAFGVLQSRFAIVRGPSRFWHPNEMKSIMDLLEISWKEEHIKLIGQFITNFK